MKKIKKLICLVDNSNTKAVAYYRYLRSVAKSKGIEIVSDAKKADLFLVMGGDGWMLKCIHDYHQFGKPFFGINFGYKGFLLNDAKEDLLDLILERDFKVYTFSFLDYEVVTEKGGAKDVSVNDVYLYRQGFESSKLKITINGTIYAENVTGDGLVISSSRGSTAYNLSAGGSAVHPALEILSIVPICAYAPVQVKPIVLPFDSSVEIEVIEPKKRRVTAVGDNRGYSDVSRVIVGGSRKKFKIALLEGDDFTSRLVRKIMRVN